MSGKSIWIWCILGLLLLLPALFAITSPVASKADVNLLINLYPQKVEERILYTFVPPIKEDHLEFGADKASEDISVLVNGKAAIFDRIENDGILISISPNESVKELELRFTSKEAVFENSGIFHFFLELDLNRPFISHASARIVLPLGYGLSDESFKPSGGVISSNGRNIVITWDNLNTKGENFFSVKFASISSSASGWLLFVIGSLASLLVFSYFHFRKKKQKALFYGFREDEQKAIQFIKTNGEIMQKALQQEFKFSRAKATRIVKKLEEKKLIAKEEIGRTNRISWRGEPPDVALAGNDKVADEGKQPGKSPESGKPEERFFEKIE
ncbi:hypothetical protein HYU14_04615 [Candidatus Woesearchaeota archaeon]|nr:hypothetical protein [Candidatus Woesearchaeota archaeon]